MDGGQSSLAKAYGPVSRSTLSDRNFLFKCSRWSIWPDPINYKRASDEVKRRINDFISELSSED
jgi:hypothetical protein